MTAAIRKLSDSELVSQLKSAVSKERKRMLLVLEYLREVDRRRLYADHDCSSLWDFCVKVLRYSEGAAQRRLSAMRLLREIPELKADLLSGKQSLSSLVQAQAFFRLERKVMPLTIDEKRAVLKSLDDLSAREGKRKLIAMSSFPAELAHPEREYIIDDEHTELRIIVDASLLAKLKRVKELRSNASPGMKYAELLNYLADEALKRLEKEPGPRAVPKPVSPPASAAPNSVSPPASAVRTSASHRLNLTPKRRPIPAAIRRQIRSAGVCSYRNPTTGAPCGAKHFLEIDHIIPFALGGTDDPRNLQLRCRAHNQRSAYRQGILKVPL